MAKKKIVRNVFINKRTGQYSITLPKKKWIELFGIDKIEKVEIIPHRRK